MEHNSRKKQYKQHSRSKREKEREQGTVEKIEGGLVWWGHERWDNGKDEIGEVDEESY